VLFVAVADEKKRRKYVCVCGRMLDGIGIVVVVKFHVPVTVYCANVGK